jgi:hypothetical protein
MMSLVGSDAVSCTKDTTETNSTYIIRSQLQSIAGEVIDSTKFNMKERVAVIVEGEGPRTLTENAFIDVFQKRNYTSVAIDTASTNQILQIVLLNVENKVRELDPKVSERMIQITLEARTIRGPSRDVRLLGTFQRETKDTAQVFGANPFSAAHKNDDNGILQRMLTPLIVVGSAIVIVYLFFTVRS